MNRCNTNLCVISIGSNTDAIENLAKANEILNQYFKPVRYSRAGFTIPIGLQNSRDFLNQVASFSTSMEADEITSILKRIELKLGRNKRDKENIAIDLDLVCYNRLVLKQSDYERGYFQSGLSELNSKVNMKFIGIIPARYASTRFPAKPLAILGGKPVIQRVYEQVKSVLDDVYVATDDVRIEEVVKSFGGHVIMTSVDHRSGTDRCYEAYIKVNQEFDVVINIQGDEPFIQQSQIEALKSCFEDATTDIATLVKPFTTANTLVELENPNSPKVVVSPDHSALYFSRSVIPYLRGVDKEEWLAKHTFYKHIGLYAYKADVLKEITSMEQTPLEVTESLEQLRWLENGLKIRVAETAIETIGIDTPEDLQKAEEFLKHQQIKQD